MDFLYKKALASTDASASACQKLLTRWQAVQKGGRLGEVNPKVYVYTSRGELRVK